MSTALAVHTPPAGAGGLVPAQPPRLGLLRPLAAPAEIITSQEEARELVAAALKEGRDYGKIPGVDKPSLLKPGAERLNLAFGCAARFKVVEQEFDHDRVVEWRKVKKEYSGPKGNRKLVGEVETRGTSLGLYRYVVECEIVHRESGIVVAACLGSCSTMESKYIDRPRDSENTIIKMAEKRALVGATLLAYGLSEQFTQDVEDMPREAVASAGTVDDDAVKCPKCQGPMWDNRAKNDEREKEGKKRMPDYKCKDQKCEEVIWNAAEFAEQLANAEQVATKGKEQGAQTETAAAAGGARPSNAATEYQISKILELCDDARVPDALAESTRERLKKFISTSRADEILVGLETTIKKATPAAAPEGEQRQDPTPSPVSSSSTSPSPTSSARAEAPATTSEAPTVQRASVELMTGTIFRMLADEAFAKNVRDRVRTRLANTTDLTAEILEAAIAELENARIPF